VNSDIFCPSCQQWKPRQNSAIEAARKAGMNLYCGRVCAGIGRRKDYPIGPRNPDWKQLKSAYDREYRDKNRERLKAEKAAAYKIAGPLKRDKEKAYRVQRMPKHVEYCRQPEYRAYKEKYDRKRRAVKQFGTEFADAFLVLQQVENEIDSRIDRNEIYRQNGTVNKIQQRRREYERKTGNTAR
jgi:hypothetical protein